HPRLGQYEHEHTKKWAASVASADAYAFVIPEYNYFAPPSFVNAIDYLTNEWSFKAAAMVSYGGVSGGMRAAQSAKGLLTTVNMMPIPQGVALPMVMQSIKDGVYTSNALVDDSVKQTLDVLAKWAGALKTVRG
ncbi:NAD(P)H-dependent oxidoreductase, partial [Escherichia coli]|nr:NAD(P)H-dependent oxidoreductase [Escherichia coli]